MLKVKHLYDVRFLPIALLALVRLLGLALLVAEKIVLSLALITTMRDSVGSRDISLFLMPTW